MTHQQAYFRLYTGHDVPNARSHITGARLPLNDNEIVKQPQNTTSLVYSSHPSSPSQPPMKPETPGPTACSITHTL